MTTPRVRWPRPMRWRAAPAAAASLSMVTQSAPAVLGPPDTTVGSLRRRAAARAGSWSAGEWAISPLTAASRTRRSAVSAVAGMSCRARPAAAVAAVTPCRNETVPGSPNAYGRASVSSTPSTSLRPRRSARPAALGPPYPSSSAVASTRWRSSADSWSGWLYALDTVIRLTPQRAATSASVTRGRSRISLPLTASTLSIKTVSVKPLRKLYQLPGRAGGGTCGLQPWPRRTRGDGRR